MQKFQSQLQKLPQGTALHCRGNQISLLRSDFLFLVAVSRNCRVNNLAQCPPNQKFSDVEVYK